MQRDTRNICLNLIGGVCETVAVLCSAGTLLQALLVSIGFSANEIYIHSTLTQAVSVLTMLLASRWADKGNLYRRYAITNILSGVLLLGLLPICFLRQANLFTYGLLLAVAIVQSAMVGMLQVCANKLPYYIYLGNSYSFVCAMGGILSNVLSLLIGLLMSYLSARYAYADLMTFALIASCCFYAIAGLLRFFLKTVNPEGIENVAQKEKPIPLRDILLHPSFIQLLPANITRGFANGAATIFAVISSKNLGYPESVTTAIVSVQAIALLSSCVIMIIAGKKFSPRMMIFVGSLCFLGMPFLLIPNQSGLFLFLAGAILFGRNLVDIGIPVLLVKVIPAKIAGPYHAWRVVIFNGGTLLATMLATVLPMSVLLIVAAACQLYSGLVHWRMKFLHQDSPSIHREKTV